MNSFVAHAQFYIKLDILPEHIIYGGDYLVIWLKKVFNQLERIPSSLKDTIIVPIYKGKGKDPLLAKNYRGISLSSVLVKLFERAGHPTPHPCKRHVRQVCLAVIPQKTEVVQEEIKSYIDSGANIFQCFYDLEKTFDLEHNVLLNHLYKAGIRKVLESYCHFL